jgi:hypothetical protein
MTNRDTIKEFEAMFDLVSDKEEGEQSEEYGYSHGVEESFGDLENDMKQEIQQLKEKGAELEVKKEKENPHDIIRDVSANTVVEEKKPVEDMFDDFDELPEQPHKEEAIEGTKETEAEEVVVFAPETVAEVEIEEVETVEEPVVKVSEAEDVFIDKIENNDDKIKWSLKSLSSMYDSFYRKKREFLNNYMVGGEIEYLEWTKELEEAQVDVITEVFDQQVIIKQMEEIQQYRDRVKYIGVRVNNQYFLFDRFIELLRGSLARIQYLKPVLKQDGLIFEHMWDIELYFQRLKALHNSVVSTEKNLAAAYEMLSRKVTICMELPPAERYSKKSEYRSKFAVPSIPIPDSEKEVNTDLDGFDDLPTDAKAGPKENISGPCEWGDL